MKNKSKLYLTIVIIIVIIIILGGYWFFDSLKLKSCYLYEGHLNRGGNWGGEITDYVIISPYITIYNPNQNSFDRFELEYTIICNGESVAYDRLTQLYPRGVTSLHSQYNDFIGIEYRINSTEVSEETWQKIKSDTAKWVVQGHLKTYLLDDYYFTIEQTGLW